MCHNIKVLRRGWRESGWQDPRQMSRSGPKTKLRSFGEIKEKGAPERQFGHLLVQNRSQEVQEHFGQSGKAKIQYKKFKIKDFGVSGGGGHFSSCFSVFLL